MEKKIKMTLLERKILKAQITATLIGGLLADPGTDLPGKTLVLMFSSVAERILACCEL